MFESAVDKPVLLLMQELFGDARVRDAFYQAGGTALAIQRGHRKSLDIDLFAPARFRESDFESWIVSRKGRILLVEDGTVHGVIGNVRVSFLHYAYPLVDREVQWGGVRLAGLLDLAAMKAAAISQRAEKKDFFDMFELLKVLTPRQVKDAYVAKFGSDRTNCYHTLRSMFYHEDAEDSPDPLSLNGVTWTEVKEWFRSREKEFTNALLC